MLDSLVLAVPEIVSATYVVPTRRHPEAAIAIARDYINSHLDGQHRDLVLDFVDGPLTAIDVVKLSEAPRVPANLLQAFGASRGDLRAMKKTKHLIIVRVDCRPGPPLPEWTARAVAAGLARWADAPIMDAFVPQMTSVGQIEETYPEDNGKWQIASLVLVVSSTDDNGAWMTTKGLGRFGLPELWWLEVLRDEVLPAFVEPPARFEFGTGDIAAAYGDEPPDDGSTASVRLTLEVSQPDEDTFLTVLPLEEYPRSAGEFFSALCDELLGHEEGRISEPSDPEAMERAIATARASLDEVRGRFIRGRIEPGQRMMVKFRIPTADGGGEYPWLFVNSWKTPDRIHGASANNAVHDPRIRVGRNTVVAADDVVDWAIWVDGEGFIEGGWTQAVLEG